MNRWLLVLLLALVAQPVAADDEIIKVGGEEYEVLETDLKIKGLIEDPPDTMGGRMELDVFDDRKTAPFPEWAIGLSRVYGSYGIPGDRYVWRAEEGLYKGMYRHVRLIARSRGLRIGDPPEGTEYARCDVHLLDFWKRIQHGAGDITRTYLTMELHFFAPRGTKPVFVKRVEVSPPTPPGITFVSGWEQALRGSVEQLEAIFEDIGVRKLAELSPEPPKKRAPALSDPVPDP